MKGGQWSSLVCLARSRSLLTSKISAGIFSPPSISRVLMINVSRFIFRFTFLLWASVWSSNIEKAIAYAESWCFITGLLVLGRLALWAADGRLQYHRILPNLGCTDGNALQMLLTLYLSAGIPLEDEPLLRVVWWMKQINKDDDKSYHSKMASNDYSPQSHVNGISNEVKELQLFLESDRLVCFSQLVRYIRELKLSECSFNDAQKSVFSSHFEIRRDCNLWQLASKWF